jgi:hypothetical protein
MFSSDRQDVILKIVIVNFDRAACNSPSIDLALAFTGGGYFDYMGKVSTISSN